MNISRWSGLVFGAALLVVMPASAQSLKDQLVGTWSLDSNVEE